MIHTLIQLISHCISGCARLFFGSYLFIWPCVTRQFDPKFKHINNPYTVTPSWAKPLERGTLYAIMIVFGDKKQYAPTSFPAKFSGFKFRQHAKPLTKLVSFAMCYGALGAFIGVLIFWLLQGIQWICQF